MQDTRQATLTHDEIHRDTASAAADDVDDVARIHMRAGEAQPEQPAHDEHAVPRITAHGDGLLPHRGLDDDGGGCPDRGLPCPDAGRGRRLVRACTRSSAAAHLFSAPACARARPAMFAALTAGG